MAKIPPVAASRWNLSRTWLVELCTVFLAKFLVKTPSCGAVCWGPSLQEERRSWHVTSHYDCLLYLVPSAALERPGIGSCDFYCTRHCLFPMSQTPLVQEAGAMEQGCEFLSPRQHWNRGTEDVQEAHAAICAAPFPCPPPARRPLAGLHVTFLGKGFLPWKLT